MICNHDWSTRTARLDGITGKDGTTTIGDLRAATFEAEMKLFNTLYELFEHFNIHLDTDAILKVIRQETHRGILGAAMVMDGKTASRYPARKDDSYRDNVYFPVTQKQALLLHATWAKENADQPSEDTYMVDTEESWMMTCIARLHDNIGGNRRFTTTEARDIVPYDAPKMMAYARKRKLVKFEKQGRYYVHWFDCNASVIATPDRLLSEDFPHSDNPIF